MVGLRRIQVRLVETSLAKFDAGRLAILPDFLWTSGHFPVETRKTPDSLELT